MNLGDFITLHLWTKNVALDSAAHKASDPAYQAKLKHIPAGAPVSHHESHETTPPTQAADTVSLSSAAAATTPPPAPSQGSAQSGPVQATEYGYKPTYNHHGKNHRAKHAYKYGSLNNPPPNDGQQDMQKAKDKAAQDVKNGDASSATVTYDANGNIKSVGETYTQQGGKKEAEKYGDTWKTAKPIWQPGTGMNPAKVDPNYNAQQQPPDDAQKQMQKAKDKAAQDVQNGDASSATVTYDANGNIKSVGETYTEQGGKKEAEKYGDTLKTAKPIWQPGTGMNPAKVDPNYVGAVNNPPPDDAQKQMQKAKDKAAQDVNNGDASSATVTYDANGNIKSVGETYTQQGGKKEAEKYGDTLKNAQPIWQPGTGMNPAKVSL